MVGNFCKNKENVHKKQTPHVVIAISTCGEGLFDTW